MKRTKYSLSIKRELYYNISELLYYITRDRNVKKTEAKNKHKNI